MGREDVVSLKRALDRMLSDTTRLAARSPDAERDSVLQLVVANGPIRTIDVAITLDMPPSVVIRNLQALAESEFVMMDGRRQPESRLVEATEAGREEARQVAEANCNLLSVIVHEWCPDDTSALTALLTRLAEDCSMFRRRL